ncbi:MAG: UDP-N-acetylmuramate--L-alanine ligase [Anaerolineae bacterium]|nr:UDP-N-acetylmuramate--L-alanine ligase [Anaerolineae bacterium]
MKQAIQLIPGQHVHFIGIGGSGLSPIARVLLLQGYHISGSDLRSNAESDALKRDGATIYTGHDAAYVNGAECIIATSAVADDHIEILSAQAQGIPVYRRFDIMSAIMEGYTGIAIAGTHGKTTTTSMTVHLLTESAQDPTYIVGGVMANTGKNADVGDGRTFIIEADEYGNMFHGLRPEIEVITSIEFDHPDFFKKPHDLLESFRHFVGLLPDEGFLIVCADDPTAQIFARNRQVVNLPTATYGIDNSATWQATNIRYQGSKIKYDVLYKGASQGTVTLQVVGKHNILNSLAALIVAHHEGVSFRDAAQALSTFRGTSRRFDIREDVDGIVVIDDYAHHPTAIRTTIDAARKRYPERELWVIWQPHTYSRTQQLWDDYLRAFGDAHHVIVTDIYAAREIHNPDIRAEILLVNLTITVSSMPRHSQMPWIYSLKRFMRRLWF